MDEASNRQNIDFGRISAEIGIDPDVTLELLRMLFPKTRQTNRRLRQAAESGDYREVVMLAHDMKGSCGNFRLTDLYRASAELEKMGKQEDNAGKITGLSMEIDGMLDSYLKEMDRYHEPVKGSTDR